MVLCTISGRGVGAQLDPTILKELIREEEGSMNDEPSTMKSNSRHGNEAYLAIRWLEAPKSAVCKRVGAALLVDDSIQQCN
jgi:hypothetical protein